MRTLSTACTILLLAGPVQAEQSIKPKDWVAFTKETIGCANFDDAVEAERLMRENSVEAAKFVERHKGDCQVFGTRDHAWPVWEVDFGSSKLVPGTFAICVSQSADAPCGFWAIVRLRDVIKK